MFAFFFLTLALVAMTTVATRSDAAESVSRSYRGAGVSTAAMTHRADISLPLR